MEEKIQLIKENKDAAVAASTLILIKSMILLISILLKIIN